MKLTKEQTDRLLDLSLQLAQHLDTFTKSINRDNQIVTMSCLMAEEKLRAFKSLMEEMEKKDK